MRQRAKDFFGGYFEQHAHTAINGVLVVLFGGLVVWAKTKGVEMLDPLMYGAAASVMALLAWASMRALAFYRREEPVTIDNVEAKVKDWADAFRLGIRRLDVDGAAFAFTLTLNESNRLVVSRSNSLGRGRYLTLQRSLTLSADHKSVWNGLATEQQQALLSEVRLELAKTNAGFEKADLPFERLTLSMNLPITAELTEHVFMEATVDLAQAWIVARETFVLGLAKRALTGMVAMEMPPAQTPAEAPVMASGQANAE